MLTKYLLLVSVKFCLFLQTTAQNAFSRDIDKCLFRSWQTAPDPVLAKPMECNISPLVGLCYGNKVNTKPPSMETLFAVCYNQQTLIPEFTGNIVIPEVATAKLPRSDWRIDEGELAPKPQSQVNDYYSGSQASIIPNVNVKAQFFCSRGHLTPCADFATIPKRSLTMITTNAAPQWQTFNAVNWAALEGAVRSFSQATGSLYVVTGTGGAVTDIDGKNILLNKRVVIPKYFWKAVCDKVGKQSVVFLAENPVGETNPDDKEKGCNNVLQTKYNGVILCYSLNNLRSSEVGRSFKLPFFGDVCQPSKRGTFLDKYLNLALK